MPNARIAHGHPARGFSLIELVVALAIIGILAAIAVPEYRDYIRRGQAIEATSALMDLRTRMEQSYLDNRNYDNGTAGTCTVDLTPIQNNLRYFTLSCQTKETGAAPGRAAGADNSQVFRAIATGIGSLSCYRYLLTETNLREFSSDGGTNFVNGWTTSPPACP